MNWEMVAAVAQVIAALAVVPSLLYLAVQVRQQNKESRRSAATVFMTHWTDFRKSISDNADLASIHLRGLASFDSLDAVEKLRFGSALGRIMVFSDGLFRFYLDRSLDQELWKTFEQTIDDLMAYPGAQAWWATRKHWHTAKFCTLVDGMIARGTKPSLYERYTDATQ
jgi:hypothetical protein